MNVQSDGKSGSSEGVEMKYGPSICIRQRVRAALLHNLSLLRDLITTLTDEMNPSKAFTLTQRPKRSAAHFPQSSVPIIFPKLQISTPLTPAFHLPTEKFIQRTHFPKPLSSYFSLDSARVGPIDHTVFKFWVNNTA